MIPYGINGDIVNAVSTRVERFRLVSVRPLPDPVDPCFNHDLDQTFWLLIQYPTIRISCPLDTVD